MTELQKKILDLRKSGLSITKIISETGVSRGIVNYVLSRRFADGLARKKAKEKADEEFAELVKKYLPISNSLNNLCTNLGLRGVDGYYKKINRIIKENNLSTEHFGTIKIGRQNRNVYTAMSDDEFFVNGVSRHGDSIIKRLVNGGYKDYKCENCGVSEWGGKPLRLQAHHINGDHYDNRLDNIQILCPNCHTQTDTYGRNNISSKNSFKVTKRMGEILKGKESSFVPKEINEVVTKEKEVRYCERCGKKITGDGKRFCSPECSQLASMRYSVDKEELINDFKELGSYSAVGRKYGVSDVAIKKRCKKLGINEEIRVYVTPR